MKRTLLFFVPPLLFFVSPPLVSADTLFVLARNLSLGAHGEDVRVLQKLLNRDPRTQVSLAGPGSPGRETDYFGPLTRSAAMRFQEVYAKEVLHPLGLSQATGFVGPGTRGKLNALLALVEPDPPPPSLPSGLPVEPTPPAIPQKKAEIGSLAGFSAADILGPSSDLLIAFPSSYTGTRGSDITLSGSGFTRENNTVHLSDRFAISGLIAEPNALRFIIPQAIDYGKYDLWVSNANGESNKILFIVPAPGARAPAILSITPVSGGPGTKVTVRGHGFAPTGNDIRLNYGTVFNVPSPDGSSLTFEVSPYEAFPTLVESRGFDWPLFITIVNANGLSDGLKPGQFLLQLP